MAETGYSKIDRQTTLIPLLQASLVTFLWSSSYILIKLYLSEIPPLTFAAYRYTLAALALTAYHISLGKKQRSTNSLPAPTSIIWLGLLGYTGAQGLQFIGLFYMPAVTVTFLLNFNPLVVLVLGILLLHETPTLRQVTGVILAMVGAYLYFQLPASANDPLGVFITLVSGFSWAGYLLLVRSIMKSNDVGSVGLTTYSMLVGAFALLPIAVLIEGWRTISFDGWLVVLWLSLVNTAFAFTVWNHVLRSLWPFNLSVLQNTMLIQIAILATLFLGEQITFNMLLGILLVLAGVTIVQYFSLKTVR